MFFLGTDSGSLTTKAVLIDAKGDLLSSGIVSTGSNAISATDEAIQEVCRKVGTEARQITRWVATGYGRVSAAGATRAVTEITCHAKGVFHELPATRTIIDIGGQDSKIIRINEKGKVLQFTMNDKCAAGTGRFLEVMAQALGVRLQDLSPLDLAADEETDITSVCTVFAESEIVGLVARGERKENIIHGLHTSIARRICGMAEQVGLEPVTVLTGGVAKNPAMKKALEKSLDQNLAVPRDPQFTGAMGAALIAKDSS